MARKKGCQESQEKDEAVKVPEKQRKRNLVGDEIDEVKKKKLFLQSEIQSVSQDADKLSLDPPTKKKSFFLKNRLSGGPQFMKGDRRAGNMEQNLVVR